MRGYKVVSPVELLGIRSAMSEDELIQIVGDHPVHMTPFGYMKLAGSMVSLVEGQRTGFAGDKRGREDGEEAEGIDNFHRKRHEWLYNLISGAGGWRGGQQGGAAARREEGGRSGAPGGGSLERPPLERGSTRDRREVTSNKLEKSRDTLPFSK